MIDYGIKIAVNGDAPEKLRKIAEASKMVEASAKTAGIKVRDEFARLIREQRTVIHSLEDNYKRAEVAARKAAAGTDRLRAERDLLTAEAKLAQGKGALETIFQARDFYNNQETEALKRARELQQEQREQQKAALKSNIYGSAALLRGIIGLYAAGVGVVGTFTKENEKLDQIQRRLAQALSVVIGLESASEAIKRMNVRQIGILTAATKAWRSAQQTLTRALWGSNVAANVLMGTLTLGLSVAIGAAIAAISKYRDAQKKAREEAGKARKAQLEFNKSVGQNASDSIVKFKQLQVQWERTGDSLSKRQEFIKKNKSAFEDLGASISKVSDAEKLFTSGEANFIQSLVNRARAMAATAKASEYLSEAASAGEDRRQAEFALSRWRTEQTKATQGDIQAGIAAVKTADLANKYLSRRDITLSADEEKYLRTIIGIHEDGKKLTDAIHKESEATRKATQLLKDNVDLTTKGEVDKSSYTPADVSDSLRGVSGNGGIKNFEFNNYAPIVQITDNHVDGKTYSPEEIGQIAAKEIVNTLSQIAVQ